MLIDIKNVSYCYKQPNKKQTADNNERTDHLRKTLDGIDFSIDRGEFLSVIGPNGSGKSTLVKLFNGLLVPDQGDILFEGLSVLDKKNLSVIRRAIGFVFQNPDNQFVSGDLEEELAFGPENLGLPSGEILQRVNQVIRLFNLEQFRQQPLQRLSGGEKQKVAIAGVIAMGPQCVVMDEPTAMLDPQTRRDIMEIIKQLKLSGITVILITHFMEEAFQADRIAVLDNGKLLIIAKPNELIKEKQLLDRLQLAVPPTVGIAQKLRGNGWKLTDSIITPEQLVDELAQWPAGGKNIGSVKRINGEENQVSQFAQSLPIEANERPAMHLRQIKLIYSKGTPYEKKVLNNTELKIQKGCVTALIGVSGSGKSTIARVGSGLLKPDQGEVLINGRRIKKIADKQLRQTVSLVFQQPERQFFADTVRQETAYALNNLQRLDNRQTEARVREALTMTGLDADEIADVCPLNLSQGQKRRVALASVLIMYPEILIIDEPTGNLNPAGAEHIMDLLRQLSRKRQMTVIIISHNLDEVYKYADRAAILYEGKIAAEGAAKEILSRADLMSGSRLNMPAIPQLIRQLKQKGYYFSTDDLSESQMLNEMEDNLAFHQQQSQNRRQTNKPESS